MYAVGFWVLCKKVLLDLFLYVVLILVLLVLGFERGFEFCMLVDVVGGLSLFYYFFVVVRG